MDKRKRGVVSTNTVQFNNITLSLTEKDIEDYTFNKSEIIGMNNLNINGTVDESMNNQKDYRFINADFEGGISVPTALFSESGRARIVEAYENFGRNSITAAKGAWGATATPYTVAGVLYGFVGYAYSHTLGDGNATIKYNKESDSLEFERNPLAIDPFTLGHSINYTNSEGYTDGKQDVKSYDRTYWVNLGQHERTHIQQYDKLGILFPAFYLPQGLQSKDNPYEKEADNNSRI